MQHLETAPASHLEEAEPVTPQSLNQETLGRLLGAGAQLRPWLLITGALLVVGLVGLLMRMITGFEPQKWGYVASLYAYIMTVAQSAPIVAVAFRLSKADWRRPITRIAELFTAVGILNLVLLIPLLIAMPSTAGRLNIWMDWTLFGAREASGIPFLTIGNLLAQLLLTFTGLALLYVSAIPDIAAAIPATSGVRRDWYTRLAGGWTGTAQQWRILRIGVGVLGALYFIHWVSTQTMLAIDFSMSMIPGWWSAIYPAQVSLVGLQSGLSITLIAMYIHRNLGGLQTHLRLDPFWALSKLQLALTLFWFYFWWSEFITVWYGRTPREQNFLQLVMFGPYSWAFYIAFITSFIIPWWALVWNPVRKSILGPPLVGVSILIGAYFNTIRLFVAPWSLDEHNVMHLEHVPAAAHLPDFIDLLIILGFLGGAVFMYLLATRLMPTLNLWEMKEGMLLRVPRPFMRSHEAVVIAKPQ